MCSVPSASGRPRRGGDSRGNDHPSAAGVSAHLRCGPKGRAQLPEVRAGGGMCQQALSIAQAPPNFDARARRYHAEERRRAMAISSRTERWDPHSNASHPIEHPGCVGQLVGTRAAHIRKTCFERCDPEGRHLTPSHTGGPIRADRRSPSFVGRLLAAERQTRWPDQADSELDGESNGSHGFSDNASSPASSRPRRSIRLSEW
jgi:hypothetical protein